MGSKSATMEHVGRVGRPRQVVLPQDILETLNLHVGDLVAFNRQSGGVLIKPKRALPSDDVLTPNQAKRLHRSLKQTRQGKTRPWSQIKHELDL